MSIDSHQVRLHNISIDPCEAPEGFFEQAEEALLKIHELNIGKRLFERIAKVDFPVTINYRKGCMGLCVVQGCANALNVAIKIDFNTAVTYPDLNLQEHILPSFVSLAHELIHAMHHTTDTNCAGDRADKLIWTDDEEYNTMVGFTEDAITEHAFERELRIPLRLSHIEFVPDNSV